MDISFYKSRLDIFWNIEIKILHCFILLNIFIPIANIHLFIVSTTSRPPREANQGNAKRHCSSMLPFLAPGLHQRDHLPDLVILSGELADLLPGENHSRDTCHHNTIQLLDRLDLLLRGELRTQSYHNHQLSPEIS